MALLTTYNANNRVIYNDKTVTYSKRKIYGSWSYVSGISIITINEAWEYHRYCTKTYAYVGMSLEAANSCAEAMISKYTRSFNISEWSSSLGTFSTKSGGSMTMADISIQKREGHLYDVMISVREDDSRTSRSSTTPSSLFTAENNRDYDIT